MITKNTATKQLVYSLCMLMGIALLTGLGNCASDTEDSSSASIPQENTAEQIRKDSIDPHSGLIVATGFPQVRALCTSCHSAKLITQNRASREGWEQMIRWMQEKQNLMDLGTNEPIILDYLAANYAPQEAGRRANLDCVAIQ
ncbi:MAG: hypothetical protein AAFO94_18605, partial [Bacteroidota bacterium]